MVYRALRTGELCEIIELVGGHLIICPEPRFISHAELERDYVPIDDRREAARRRDLRSGDPTYGLDRRGWSRRRRDYATVDEDYETARRLAERERRRRQAPEN